MEKRTNPKPSPPFRLCVAVPLALVLFLILSLVVLLQATDIAELRRMVEDRQQAEAAGLGIGIPNNPVEQGDKQ